MDIVTLALAKKYAADSLVGVGALKGSPCTIKSITAITGGSRITFSWTDTSNVEHTNTLDVMNGAKGDKGDDGETPDMTNYYTKTEVDSAIDSVPKTFKTINGQSIVGSGNITIQGGSGEGGTTVVANPVLSGNEELATSIQIGDEKYVFPQTNTNGLTSAQITMLESVLYSVAFTDASGKAKVDALITSLRSGATPSEPTEPDDDNPDTPSPEEPENPDDGGDTPNPPSTDADYQYTDTIPSSVESGTFNWGVGYKLNETTGAIEEGSNYAISPLIFVPNGGHLTIGNNLSNGNHYIILYTTAKAFKEKTVLSSPFNKIYNNKGKDYYYRICSLATYTSSPTTFTRG